jgi:hypothetical protein
MFIGSMEATILAYSVMPVKQLWLQLVYKGIRSKTNIKIKIKILGQNG